MFSWSCFSWWWQFQRAGWKPGRRRIEEIKEGLPILGFNADPVYHPVTRAGQPDGILSLLLPVLQRYSSRRSHTCFLMGHQGSRAERSILYGLKEEGFGIRKIVPLFAAVFGLGLIAFSLSRSFWFQMVLMLVAGSGMIMQMTSSNTSCKPSLMMITRPGNEFLFNGVYGYRSFRQFAAGFLASRIGAPATLMIGGTTCVLGAVVFAKKTSGDRKKMIHPIYVRLGIIRRLIRLNSRLNV